MKGDISSHLPPPQRNRPVEDDIATWLHLPLRIHLDRNAANVSQFHPEELSVNVVGNGLVIEGHHQEREDNGGLVERHFVRKYFLPKSAKPEELVSKLSEDGLLSVTMPKVETVENVRSIPIEVDPKWKMQPCRDVVLHRPIPLWWW
uniref:Heat shock protein 26 n=1 Tax=Ascaris suum TaxID=6253 RepID=F1LDV7_ASCSU